MNDTIESTRLLCGSTLQLVFGYKDAEVYYASCDLCKNSDFSHVYEQNTDNDLLLRIVPYGFSFYPIESAEEVFKEKTRKYH